MFYWHINLTAITESLIPSSDWHMHQILHAVCDRHLVRTKCTGHNKTVFVTPSFLAPQHHSRMKMRCTYTSVIGDNHKCVVLWWFDVYHWKLIVTNSVYYHWRCLCCRYCEATTVCKTTTTVAGPTPHIKGILEMLFLARIHKTN